MQINPAESWSDFITSAKSDLRLVAHPGGASCAQVFQDWLTARRRTVHIAIGPEGGLTDDEIAISRVHGWRPVDLGRRILRIETAAVALAGLFTLASE